MNTQTQKEREPWEGWRGQNKMRHPCKKKKQEEDLVTSACE